MTVTAVEEYTKGRYKIFLNDEFAFVLYKGELRKTGIERFTELEEGQIREIIDTIICRRAKERALNLLKSRDYTEKALRRKLKESLYPEEVIESTLRYVKSYGYIDDLRFAQNYVRSNVRIRSRKEMRFKLLEKGISEEAIEAAFEEEGGDDTTEDDLIRALLKKNLRNRDAQDRVVRQRIMARMYAKGFSINKVERLFDEVLLDITS